MKKDFEPRKARKGNEVETESSQLWPRFGDAEIVAARPRRNQHDSFRPQGFFVEQEHSRAGTVDDVATLLLTNRECPFRCLMCDLWQGTLVESGPTGAIPTQIDFALSQINATHSDSVIRHIKLYNSGNFFDPQAIPREDHAAIAELVRHYQTVIVENHPRMCRDDCVRFQDLLQQSNGGAQLEVALGVETVHPQVLERLNKRMTVTDVERAAEFLRQHDIAMRAFILLRPPFLSEAEGIEWCLRSVEFAFEHGIDCCSIIPVRAGNGIMERLQRDGWFSPPSLEAVEATFDETLKLVAGRGRVLIDGWNLTALQSSTANPDLKVLEQRRTRLRQMNLVQRILPRI